MLEELVAEVDKENKLIGYRPRSEFNILNLIHRSVGLLLLNRTRDKLLIGLRSKDKKAEPYVYSHSVDGAVGKESSKEAIIRETEEELGITVDVTEIYSYFHDDSHGYNRVWKEIYTSIVDINLNIKRSKKDFEVVKWIDLSWLKDDIQKNEDIYAESFIQSMDIYFDMIYNKT